MERAFWPDAARVAALVLNTRLEVGQGAWKRRPRSQRGKARATLGARSCVRPSRTQPEGPKSDPRAAPGIFLATRPIRGARVGQDVLGSQV